METHKEATVKLNSPLVAADKQAINRFADLLRENGNQIKWDDEKISVFLYELDYHLLQHHADKINADFNTDILSAVLGKIDSIKSYGLHGKKRLYVGYDKERKTIGRKQKEQQRGRHFYAEDAHFSQNNTVLPKKQINQIICADSEQFLHTLPDNCVDLILTSPPYNFGLDYDDSQDAHHWQQYFDKLFAIFDECIRVLKYGGRIIVNVQPLFSDYIPTHHLISSHFINKKLIWRVMLQEMIIKFIEKYADFFIIPFYLVTVFAQ